jgi:hypothetical protein
MDTIRKYRIELLCKKGVWGEHLQQAMAYAAGKRSELMSDPCRRHGQKLVWEDWSALKQSDSKKEGGVTSAFSG